MFVGLNTLDCIQRITSGLRSAVKHSVLPNKFFPVTQFLCYMLPLYLFRAVIRQTAIFSTKKLLDAMS
jgi:hypothetical protein